MQSKLISIIIPIYNGAKYIAETVQSVVAQRYTHWELIIVDDGSTDNTREVIQSIPPHPQIHYINQPNAGVSAARNHGFRLSKGQYIAFLDADDVWLPERLEKMLEKFEGDPELGLVHTYMQVIDENSIRQPTIYKGKEGKVLDDLLLWEGCVIPAPSSILVKREVVEEVGGFSTDLSTAADQEFFFRVAQKYKIGMVPEVLGLYRIHGNNMHQNISRMESDHLLAYQKAKELNLFKSSSFQRKCFSNLYMILAGSWWINGNNKRRGIYFALKSLVTYPANLTKLLQKKLSL